MKDKLEITDQLRLGMLKLQYDMYLNSLVLGYTRDTDYEAAVLPILKLYYKELTDEK